MIWYDDRVQVRLVCFFVLLFVVVVLFCVEKMREKRTLLFALNDENVREGRQFQYHSVLHRYVLLIVTPP